MTIDLDMDYKSSERLRLAFSGSHSHISAIRTGIHIHSFCIRSVHLPIKQLLPSMLPEGCTLHMNKEPCQSFLSALA